MNLEFRRGLKGLDNLGSLPFRDGIESYNPDEIAKGEVYMEKRRGTMTELWRMKKNQHKRRRRSTNEVKAKLGVWIVLEATGRQCFKNEVMVTCTSSAIKTEN